MVWSKQTHRASSWDRSNYVFRMCSMAVWAFMPLSLLIHSIGLDTSHEQPTASISSTKTGHTRFGTCGMSIIIGVQTHIHKCTHRCTQILLRRLGVLETEYSWDLGLGFLDQLGSSAYCNHIDIRNHCDIQKKGKKMKAVKQFHFVRSGHALSCQSSTSPCETNGSVRLQHAWLVMGAASALLFIEVPLKERKKSNLWQKV